jgi:hypothetical protein
MARDIDRMQATEVIGDLRASADRLISQSRKLVKEAQQMKQRADDLEQLVKQHDKRKK